MQYSYDSEKWEDYKAPIEVSKNNTTIYVCQRNAIGERSGYASTEIKTIDTDSPLKFVPKIEATTNKITIDATKADDAPERKGESGKSGIKSISYICHKDGEEENWVECGSEEKTKDFTGLTDNTTYKIKVKVKDNADNEMVTDEQTFNTLDVPDGGDGADGSIIFGDVIWNKDTHTASVQISKGTGVDEKLKIQYQVGTDVGTNWTDGGDGTNATEITTGQTVYARLTDGNNTGGNARKKVEDTTPPKEAEITFNKESYVVGETIEVTVKLQDDESGVNVGASGYVINTNAEDVTEEMWQSFTDDDVEQTISYKPDGPGTYYVHIKTVDYNGVVVCNSSPAPVVIVKIAFDGPTSLVSLSNAGKNRQKCSFTIQPGWGVTISRLPRWR